MPILEMWKLGPEETLSLCQFAQLFNGKATKPRESDHPALNPYLVLPRLAALEKSCLLNLSVSIHQMGVILPATEMEF